MSQRRPLRPAVILIALLWGLLCFLNSCATETVTRQLVYPGTPQEAYTQAAQTFARMGGKVEFADPQARVITGVVKGAVQMNVTVDPQSMVSVTGHVIDGKVAFGKVDEVDTYLDQLKKDMAHAR